MDNSNETPIRHGKESDGIDLLSALRIVRSAGGALCTQAGLYGQLAHIEWLEEKSRLRNMLLNKWLDYCMERGHCFTASSAVPLAVAAHERLV